ncbi:hypothetical protein PENANT_c008G00281 [Penicillium antarcticum]|uniref:Uncharacterized protein n=1 Tax=Penicillium antarcticum TaxID=416450 RepID=A0A1V6QAT3_9EURO|nr:hypothetical protein PENANT_c008G00281 [Penicillium antarcticum]
MLTLHEDNDVHENEDEDKDADTTISTTARPRKQKHPKCGQKSKTKRNTSDGASRPELQQIELEDYGIIEVDDTSISHYKAAHDFCVLRDLCYDMQDIWPQVAYDGLNTAVAAGVCNVATGRIKDEESQSSLSFWKRDF